MVEALRDIPVAGQDCFSRCCISINAGKSYKEISSYNLKYNQFKKYNKEIWYDVIRYYQLRLRCFWNHGGKELAYQQIYQEINTKSIHWKQQDYYVKTYQMIFVLSAFPLFLLEYFGSGAFGCQGGWGSAGPALAVWKDSQHEHAPLY